MIFKLLSVPIIPPSIAVRAIRGIAFINTENFVSDELKFVFL